MIIKSAVSFGEETSLLFPKAKQDVSVFDGVMFVAQSFKLKFSGGLKCLHA